MEKLLTSVILTYNHEDGIARCIESMINQITDYSYEIHIWDDCSTDKTPEICKEYAQKYPDKIKLFLQKENTFLKPYNQTQAYKAMQNIDTKYFCIIEGDDYWCDENKIQLALDFLENNPEYSGWGHDTLQIDLNDGSQKSWVHDIAKYEVKNPIKFDDKFIFLMTSSRIFRMYDFKRLNIWPVDYLVYNYHLEKGPIYFYDKIMAAYQYGNSAGFSGMGESIEDLNKMFAYKLCKIFDFKQDDYCMKYQKNYETLYNSKPFFFNLLKILKLVLGKRLGWTLWFIIRFVPKYGFESMNTNYVYSRKLVKQRSNKIQANKQKITLKINEIENNIEQTYCNYLQNKNDILLKQRYEEALSNAIWYYTENNLGEKIEILNKNHKDLLSVLTKTMKEKIYQLTLKNKKYKYQRNITRIMLVITIICILAILFIPHILGVLR